jgi:hypothetical protein
MNSLRRQKWEFHVIQINRLNKFVLIKDLLSGLKIEIPYGDKELDSAKFVDEFELHLIYQDGSEKSVNLLMQGLIRWL